MCGPTLDTRGGIATIVRNYLAYGDWGEYRITYIPTYYYTNCRIAQAPYFCMRYIQIVCRALSGKYRIAHLHTSGTGSFWRKAILMVTLRAMGLKVFMHHHGSGSGVFHSTRSGWQQRCVKWVLKNTSLNIVLGEHLAGWFGGVEPRAHFAVLHNAVNTNGWNFYNNSGRYVLHLGRLGRRKGTFDLLEVIRRLDGSIDKDIRFLLCGDGMTRQVWQRARELGIAHRIGHIGWTDRKKGMLDYTMICVLPSYSEGMPMSILETMAYGIPNISTGIADILEVIEDGVNGFLIAPGDTEALEDRLRTLIGDPALRERFSRAAYDTIGRQFSLRHHIQELKGLYAGHLS